MAATTIPIACCSLVVILLCTCSSPLFPWFSDAKDILQPGELIRDGETLVSSGGSFELGFFIGVSGARYVGIWYKNITKVQGRTVVWVANRDNPLQDSSGVFSFNSQQNLLVYDQLGYSFVITYAYGKGVVLKLLDNGNLVLKYNNSSDEDYLQWQSFDHPTDTILPGMKPEPNKQSIVSWAGEDDPSSGSFSLGFDSSGQQQFIWQKGTLFLGSEILRDQSFKQIPENFSGVFYFNGLDPNILVASGNSSVSRIVLDWSGKLKYFTWLEAVKDWNLVWTKPDDQCRIHGYCGAFSICSDNRLHPCHCLEGFRPVSWRRRSIDMWSVGCLRNNYLQCQNSSANRRTDEFQMVKNVRFPADHKPLQVRSMEECKLACQKNCYCTAYSARGRDCLIWTGDLLNIKELSSESNYSRELHVRIVPDTHPKGKKKLLRVVIAEIAILTVLLLLFALFLCNLRRKKWNLKRRGKAGVQDLFSTNLVASGQPTAFVQLGVVARKGQVLPLLKYSSVEASTDNFSVANKLGENTAGPVYKGTLQKGQEIAVRKFSRTPQGADDFKNEISLLAELQHINLVRLLGCCIERDERMLIYEYMPNKSLDLLLFDPAMKSLLDWGKRARIIEGIAQGILYLHKFSRLKIIHQNITANNILLDAEMNPKISEFSMARVFQQGDSHINRKRTFGTFGYMSPEYSVGGLLSEKTDVFSFGVLLLEIVSGQMNFNFYHLNQIDLPAHAWKLWKGGVDSELMDPTLGASAQLDQVMRYIHVGLLCVQENPANRPTISDVVFMLSKGLTALPSPKKPAFSCNATTLETLS